MTLPSPSGSDDKLSSYGSILVGEMPSKASTDAAVAVAVRGYYQSVKPHESATSLDIDLDLDVDQDIKEGAASKRNKRDRFLKFLLASAFLVVISACVGLAGTSSPFWNRSKKPSYKGAPKSKVPFPFSSVGADEGRRKQPLSTLHPVYDLGLPQFSRPEDSRPPKALLGSTTKARQLAAEDGNSGGGESQGPGPGNNIPNVFPTNAWYQNMLLVRDGDEPTEVNRAYSTPFLVDAVGPIPGLRVHANHVDASTAVVQLNSVNTYGLTVGAAPDGATLATLMAATSAAATTEDSNATNTAAARDHSNKYSVENMTPLGVTLAWVSFRPTTHYA